MLNGDAHLSEIEGEQAYASDPLPLFSKTGTRRRIPHGHLRPRLAPARPRAGLCRVPGLTVRGEGAACNGAHARPLGLFSQVGLPSGRAARFSQSPAAPILKRELQNLSAGHAKVSGVRTLPGGARRRRCGACRFREPRRQRRSVRAYFVAVRCEFVGGVCTGVAVRAFFRAVRVNSRAVRGKGRPCGRKSACLERGEGRGR
jgi:hypothetical protein